MQLGSMLRLEGGEGNVPNCLIKNLFEMDTLPHLKIYSKLPVPKQGNRSVLQEEMEGSNDVNDGRRACIDQKLCPPLCAVF